MIVERRCAIKMVTWFPCRETSRIVSVISSSVNESSAEVASSNKSSLGCRSNALAIDKRCFSPPEKF